MEKEFGCKVRQRKEIFMKENIKMTKNVDTEYINGKMDRRLRVTLKTI